MSNPINLDQSYSSTLSNALQQVFLATELGGNANLINTFSYAGAGNSIGFTLVWFFHNTK